MDLQQFEAYAPVVIRLLRSVLPPMPGAELQDYALAALEAVQRGGAEELCRWLRAAYRRLEYPDREFDARLRHALTQSVPAPADEERYAAWSTLQAAAAAQASETGAVAEGAGVEEQRAALVTFVLGHDATDPEALIGAIAARIQADPTLHRRLLEAGFNDLLLRDVRDYASRVVKVPERDFDAMLSYCSADLAEALAIRDALTGRGFLIWNDPEHMNGGHAVIWRLCEVIELIRRYIVCCGESVGRWQHFEVGHMVGLVIREEPSISGRPRCVIPVILARVPANAQAVPSPLHGFSWIDLRKVEFKEGIDQIERALRQ